MKKSLIALAALAASTAFAQSSVTMYGVMDLSLTKGTGSNFTGFTLPGNPGAGTVPNLWAGQMNSGVLSGSRIGWRGVEDLGGGLKAGFNYELGFNGANGGLNTAAARTSTLSLSSDSMGTFSMGRSLTTGFGVNYISDVTGASAISSQQFVLGYTGGARNSGEFRYTSPNFSGFQVAVGAVPRANAGTANHKFDLAAQYNNGPIAVGAAFSSVGAPAGAANRNDWAIHGAYDFGSFKLTAGYADNRASGANLNAPWLGLRGFTLGGVLPLGAVGLMAQYTRSADNFALAANGGKVNAFTLAGTYSLSKRTTAYAGWMYANLAAGTSTSMNIFGAGVRHTF